MRFTLLFTIVMILLILAAFSAAGQTVPQPSTTQPASALPAAPSPAASGATPAEEQEWSNVQQLVHDQPIHVFASGSRRETCLFTGATGAMLFCEPEFASRPGFEYRFSRADVETIRLDQTHRNMRRAVMIPLVAGAVAGVILGAVVTDKNGCPAGVCEIAGGAVGAGAGALFGAVISLPAGLLIPGKRIYQREHSVAAHHSANHLHFHFLPAPAAP